MKVNGIFKLIILSSLNISFKIALAQTLQFSSEAIEITISDGYAVVNGDYTFNNISENEINRTLFYPFPVSQSYPFPDSIFISDKNNKKIPFIKSSSGIYFSINIPSDSETAIKISYYQKLNSDEMKYILTSTQKWKHPLQKAEYKILLPKEFNLINLSLKPDKENSDLINNIYIINKQNFMPERDLIITWARRGK